MGDKLFNEKITIKQDRDPANYPRPFFDMEGVVLEGDSYTLVKEGKLVGVYTDKRTASTYNCPIRELHRVPMTECLPLQMLLCVLL